MNHLTTFFLFGSTFCFGQVIDDFSDGDFRHNPTWFGDSSEFHVIDHRLESNGSGQDSIHLLTRRPDSAETWAWEAWFEIGFSPSSNNYLKFHLSTDSNLSSGYYLRIGQSGSNDPLCFMHFDGNRHTLLAQGQTNLNLFTHDPIRLKCIKTQDSIHFYIDRHGGNYFSHEFSIPFSAPFSGGFFGWENAFTSSNSRGFKLDDVYHGELKTDTLRPHLKHLAVKKNELILQFDEEIDSTGFILALWNNDTLSVQHIHERNQVVLKGDLIGFGRLTLAGTIDLSGNPSPPIDTTFFIEEIQFGDLALSELMIDPSPSIGLPETEYIEVFNRREYPINLSWFRLNLNNQDYPLPDFILPPNKAVVLAEAERPFCSNFHFLSLPALSNSGFDIELTHQVQTIHGFSYQPSHLETHPKSQGGWSLENTNINQPCFHPDLWDYSSNFLGGSPGFLGSQTLAEPSPPPLFLTHILLHDSLVVELQFSSPLAPENYGLNQLGLSPWVDSVHLDFKGAVLVYLNRPISNQPLHLDWTGVQDCFGDETSSGELDLFLPIPPKTYGQVGITELMYEPKTGEGEWIELYNASPYYMDLSEFFIASEVDGKPGPFAQISEKSYLVPPHSTLVLAEKGFFPESCHGLFVVSTSIPSLTNSGGGLFLANKNLTVLDSIRYSPSSHHPFLDETKGVSLERTSPQANGWEELSWSSSTNPLGHSGTCNINPPIPIEQEQFFDLAHPSFSPNLDGFRDHLELRYTLPLDGYSLNLLVFTFEGQPVAVPVENLILPRKGVFHWSGIGEDGSHLSPGPYLLSIQAHHPSGESLVEKLSFVLEP